MIKFIVQTGKVLKIPWSYQKLLFLVTVLILCSLSNIVRKLNN